MSPVSSETNLTRSRLEKPLAYSGSLDKFQHVEMTPIAGRLYHDVQITDLLDAANADELLQDLAVTISQRGVVFFPSQASLILNLSDDLLAYSSTPEQNLTLANQKRFVQRIGELSGKPHSSGLHVHPLFNSPDNEAVDAEGHFDKQVYVVSNRAQLKLYKDMAHRNVTVTDAANEDEVFPSLTFEPLPADYSCLILSNTPHTGGDTLWCSSTALYDKISPPYRAFLETLTATYAQPVFVKSAIRGKFDIMSPRGSPLNAGTDFSSVHPVVRTNPVTGLKSIFAVGLHCEKINDVHPYEDRLIRDYFMHLITRSHDIQVRYKWGSNDVAVWDNRAVYHAATPDLPGGIRFGNRVTSIGEKPYFDPASKSREEALADAAL